jgi:ATP-dependent protease ClpP protease subunit
MIHDVSNWCAGKIEELKSSVNETERLGKLVLSIMDSNCEHEDGYFEKNLYERKHSDWFLTAEEAKNNNIINHIKIPKFEVSVSAEIKFC